MPSLIRLVRITKELIGSFGLFVVIDQLSMIINLPAQPGRDVAAPRPVSMFSPQLGVFTRTRRLQQPAGFTELTLSLPTCCLTVPNHGARAFFYILQLISPQSPSVWRHLLSFCPRQERQTAGRFLRLSGLVAQQTESKQTGRTP